MIVPRPEELVVTSPFDCRPVWCARRSLISLDEEPKEGRCPRKARSRFSISLSVVSHHSAYHNDMKETRNSILQRQSSAGFQILSERINSDLQRDARIAIAAKVAETRAKCILPVNEGRLFTTINLMYEEWPDECKALCSDIIVSHSLSMACYELIILENHAPHVICPNKIKASSRRAYWRLRFDYSKRSRADKHIILRNFTERRAWDEEWSAAIYSWISRKQGRQHLSRASEREN